MLAFFFSLPMAQANSHPQDQTHAFATCAAFYTLLSTHHYSPKGMAHPAIRGEASSMMKAARFYAARNNQASTIAATFETALEDIATRLAADFSRTRQEYETQCLKLIPARNAALLALHQQP